jgi:Starch-binding associating with outer membrane
MKTFQTRIKSIALVAVASSLTALIASCSQWIDPNINTDPNNPSAVSITTQLPSIEGSLAFTNGGQISRFACMFTQQFIGSDRQHAGYYEYLITENDIGPAIWDNYYSVVQKNAQNLIQQAGSGSPYYRGAGRVLLAYGMAAVTDVWGDAPFSETFRLQRDGTGVLVAKFDSQQAIYTALQLQLDSAIIDLNSPTNAIAFDYSIGGAPVDALYGGDKQKWLRAAWTLKARLAIHTTKRNGASASQDALRFLQRGLQSNGDNMQFAFGTSAATPNPLFGFMRDRADIDIGPMMEKMLNSLNDPRTPAFAAVDVGKVSAGNGDGFGALVASGNSSVMLLSFTEAKFIEAEANQRLGNTDAARTAFIDAVNASLAATGVSADDAKAYTDQTSVVPASGITLQRIMEQKYIALFTQPEVWTDWRRTGFPVLTPVSGSAVPRRLLIPQSERLYNGANVPAGSNQPTWLLGRVWWDAN